MPPPPSHKGDWRGFKNGGCYIATSGGQPEGGLGATEGRRVTPWGGCPASAHCCGNMWYCRSKVSAGACREGAIAESVHLYPTFPLSSRQFAITTKIPRAKTKDRITSVIPSVLICAACHLQRFCLSIKTLTLFFCRRKAPNFR